MLTNLLHHLRSKLNSAGAAFLSPEKWKKAFPPQTIAAILIGSFIASFGLINIHRRVQITEGGILGLLLLLYYWFRIPSSILSPILDGICYLLGYRFFGRIFLLRSLAATCCLAVFLRLWESVPYLFPDLTSHPLLASVCGAVFIGVGVGLVVRQGASCGGDDALAMIISHLTHCRISRAYLVTDLTVLTLSLSYIPFSRILYSLITVTLSSWILEKVQPPQTPVSYNSRK